MNPRTKPDEEDDGRVIAPMNVEGMPWYHRGVRTQSSGEKEDLTPRGKLAFAWGVIKAGLLVVAVFAGLYFLFLLFCTKIWFR